MAFLWKPSESASYHSKFPVLIKTSLQIALSLIIFHFYFSATAQKMESSVFFEKQNFHKDTLYIKARFMGCGEWGGHIELTRVFLKSEDFHLIYQKFKADCSKIKENNGEPMQTLVNTIERPLIDNDKQLIKQYAGLLVVAKFREPPYNHAANIFEMKNTEETLNIQVYSWGQTTKDEYLDFIARLIN